MGEFVGPRLERVVRVRRRGRGGRRGNGGRGKRGRRRSPDVAFDQSGVPTEIAEGAATVFDAYARAGLAAVAKAAHDEDDGQEDEGQAGLAALDERLGLAAQVARAAPDATLPLLKAAIDAKKTQLGAAASANLDPTVALEELWWLARLTPHVLADPFDGEIPLPPDALAESSRRAAREGRERAPCDELGAAYVDLACLCLDEAGRRAASPRADGDARVGRGAVGGHVPHARGHRRERARGGVRRRGDGARTTSARTSRGRGGSIAAAASET